MNAQVAAFVEAMKADANLEEKVRSATSAQAIIDLAAARGIVLTEADVTLPPADGADISDAELESASGGRTGFCSWNCSYICME